MPSQPVLILTAQPALWLRWQQLSRHGFQPVQGRCGQDIQVSGYQLVVLDAAFPALPAWNDPCWYQYFQDARVLVLSAQTSDEEGQILLSRGAWGYGASNMDLEAIARILWSLEQGSIWMGRSLLQKLLRDIDQRLPPSISKPCFWTQGLSMREQEVASLAAAGQSNAEIASSLNITERTVRAHLSSVFEKLAVSDRLQLALKVHGIKN